MRQFVVLAVMMLGLLPGAVARSIEDVPNVHVADARRYVSNPDDVLSPSAVARLDSILADLWRQTSSEVVVVAVGDMSGVDVDTYATELFSSWGIGKKDNDNGLLILISRDDRRAALRTGYGLEGVLPDAVCGRIIRNVMAPAFKEGDYDGGTIEAVSSVARIISNPDVAAEVRSRYANDAPPSEDEDFSSLLRMILVYACVMTAVAFGLVFVNLRRSRRESPQERYVSLNSMRLPVLVLSGVGLGLPALAYLFMNRKLRKLRNEKRLCPNCSHEMVKMDEEHDNDYLTPAQDTEEKLNSVDYDVWLCNNCGETDVIPFVNSESPYMTCPVCGAKACNLVATRTLVKPTTTREGRGERIYRCHNCRKESAVPYNIAKVAVPPVVIIPGGGRGFGGGGGFSGGSFGGGMTGGGGASGGW